MSQHEVHTKIRQAMKVFQEHLFWGFNAKIKDFIREEIIGATYDDYEKHLFW